MRTPDGLYSKFRVARVDGRDQPGGDKAGARYFVLDYVHDENARAALMLYADLCEDELPALASDLRSQAGGTVTSSARGVTLDRINAARGIVPMTLEQARQVVAAVLNLRPDQIESDTRPKASGDETVEHMTPDHNLFRCPHPICRRDAEAAGQDATGTAPNPPEAAR